MRLIIRSLQNTGSFFCTCCFYEARYLVVSKRNDFLLHYFIAIVVLFVTLKYVYLYERAYAERPQRP